MSSCSPLLNLAATNLGVLASPTPSLTPQERLGLLAFLSHRYTLTFAEIANPADLFVLTSSIVGVSGSSGIAARSIRLDAGATGKIGVTSIGLQPRN